jgi:hypothetical protein
VGGQDARAPFYGVGRGAEWSGDGGERAAVMVCHDGAGGGHFGSESARAVVGSDEGGASAISGAEGVAQEGGVRTYVRQRWR